VDWHHLTGRPVAEAPYLDLYLVVPLCRRHHAREHVLLRDKGFEFMPVGADLLEHRLLRVVLFAERCADFQRPFVLQARAAGALAALTEEVLDSLAKSSPERLLP